MIEDFFQSLEAHRVSYLLIDGQAAILYGAAFFSEDIDLWVSPDQANLERLRLSLHAVDARIGNGGGGGRDDGVIDVADRDDPRIGRPREGLDVRAATASQPDDRDVQDVLLLAHGAHGRRGATGAGARRRGGEE